MIGELAHTLDYNIRFVEQSVADVSDQQMVEQPPRLFNHATWTLGHLIHSCEGIAIELGVEPWLPVDWESTFGYGSTPLPDQAHYPKKTEMLALLADSANRLRHTLLEADDAILTRALPDETFPTMGHLLLQVVVGHTAYHTGQLAAWRRAIGKPSIGAFI